MKFRLLLLLSHLTLGAGLLLAGEEPFVSLRNMENDEVKSAGFTLKDQAVVHIHALGGGTDRAWTGSRGGGMFAYGWIINAESRQLLWRMTMENTSRQRDDREFDGTLTLPRGAYEVYFTAYAFEHRTAFSHFVLNVDHRKKPLFGPDATKKRGFFSWFKEWFSEDFASRWGDRSKAWGIDLSLDGATTVGIESFSPPQQIPNTVLRIAGAGDNEYLRRGFALDAPVTLRVYALGESTGEMEDNAWIVNAETRERIWGMSSSGCSHAGGSRKNIRCDQNLTLPKGHYLLTYVTDGTHSAADWNEEPPSDPLNYGITLILADAKDRSKFRETSVEDFQNVVVSLVRLGDNEQRSQGFTLSRESQLRIYAIGERGNARRSMADYGFILDARTRERVWTMDVDRTVHAGGASKNRLIDEVITLPRGSYIVTFTTDDSHGYGEWNDDPPYDREHYGITVMGTGQNWTSASSVAYVEERQRNVAAQIIRVGDDANKSERFSIDRPTRVRIYAIGEGQNREMFDYGWIEDARSGAVVWEMTYGMTFHAGGGRKNRLVNTTILLDRGEYLLRYRSDDTHSYGDWNVDPPDDQEYWGITIYREDAPEPPTPPEVPGVPAPPAPPKSKAGKPAKE